MHDPFDRVRKPATFDRAGRVALLGRFVEDMMAGRMPPDEVRLFVVGGLSAWLSGQGQLERDLWRVTGRQGSTHTPARLWSALREERQAAEEPGPWCLYSEEPSP